MSYNPLKTNLNLSSNPKGQNPKSRTNIAKKTNTNYFQKNPSINNLNQNYGNKVNSNLQSGRKGSSKNSFDIKNLKRNDNIFERYKYLANEIKKKDKKIKEVQKALEEVKLSDNPEEIRKFKNLEREKKKNYDELTNRNFQLTESKKLKKKEISELESQFHQKTRLLEERINYSKSIPELQRELSRLQEAYKSNRTALGRKDLKVKMEIEAECRETIENKLLLIVLETAKDKNDPEIQSLYQKLLKKQNS